MILYVCEVCICACVTSLFEWSQLRLPLFTHLSPLVSKQDQKEHCLKRGVCVFALMHAQPSRVSLVWYKFMCILCVCELELLFPRRRLVVQCRWVRARLEYPLPAAQINCLIRTCHKQFTRRTRHTQTVRHTCRQHRAQPQCYCDLASQMFSVFECVCVRVYKMCVPSYFEMFELKVNIIKPKLTSPSKLLSTTDCTKCSVSLCLFILLSVQG